MMHYIQDTQKHIMEMICLNHHHILEIIFPIEMAQGSRTIVTGIQQNLMLLFTKLETQLTRQLYELLLLVQPRLFL